MEYHELFLTLQQAFDQHPPAIALEKPEVTLRNFTFESEHANILPGNAQYSCEEHGCQLAANDTTFQADINLQSEGYPQSLCQADCTIEANNRFRYTLFKRPAKKKVEGLIILFHGLNERYWDKYLPWAYKLMQLTDKAVLLFPTAFHMNRAPAAWSNPRIMKQVSDHRKRQFPTIAQSTFVNAAISTRVQIKPQRFFWSGLQTYLDVIQLVTQIRKGAHEEIATDASIDLFSYSIGSLLSEILLLSNPMKLFENSRLVMFCGGATLDRMYPVSRFILDSEANIALYSFFIEHLENEFKRNERLNHYFNQGHPSGRYFHAMLSYPRRKKVREERFEELQDRIMAIGLRKDKVIPPAEIMNTLQGEFRNIAIPVEMLDFPFSYSHVIPFPNHSSKSETVNYYFNWIFQKIADFFVIRGL